MEQHEVRFSLFKNACTFIEEAARKAVEASDDPEQWKFAILNLVQAIELSFKERLRMEHPVFIYKDIDTQKNTVSIIEALLRIQKLCSCEFTNKEIATIRSAVGKRNDIVHHEFDINQKEAKVVFASLMGFLSHFFNKHLDKHIDAHVSQQVWKKLVEISQYGESLYQAALKSLNDNKYDLIYICPSCNYETFVYQDNVNTCFVCGHAEDVYECEGCGEYIFERDSNTIHNLNDDLCYIYCSECYDREMRFDYEYEQSSWK